MKNKHGMLLLALVSMLGASSAVFASGFEPLAMPMRTEASVPASIFDAPYLGVELGVDFKRHSVSHESTLTESGGSQLPDPSSTSGPRLGAVGIYGGVAKVFDRFYLAGEIFATTVWNSKIKSSSSGTMTGSGFNDTLTTSAQGRLKNSFGFDIRPGILITPDALVYVIGGIQTTKAEVSVNSSFVNTLNAADSGAMSLHKNSYLTGYRYGIGAEHRLLENLSVRVEYVGVIFKKSKMEVSGTTTSSTGSMLTTSGTFNVKQQNLVMLGLSYHFL